ncbi:MAG: response regulator [Kofleriaceae bacterium]
MARILVVDDELDVVRMVVRALAARGHQVETARDGAAALAQIAQAPPALVILDAHLPRVDGPEVCRRLRAASATRSLPILMMSSAYVSLTDADAATDVDGYVMKPFVRETLLAAVDRLLGPTA